MGIACDCDDKGLEDGEELDMTWISMARMSVGFSSFRHFFGAVVTCSACNDRWPCAEGFLAFDFASGPRLGIGGDGIGVFLGFGGGPRSRPESTKDSCPSYEVHVLRVAPVLSITFCM